MEDYPELENNPGTPNYDDNANQPLELYSNGAVLDPEELEMLYEAHPELRLDADFFGEGMNAA